MTPQSLTAMPQPPGPGAVRRIAQNRCWLPHAAGGVIDAEHAAFFREASRSLDLFLPSCLKEGWAGAPSCSRLWGSPASSHNWELEFCALDGGVFGQYILGHFSFMASSWAAISLVREGQHLAARMPALSAPSMATVATGMPLGHLHRGEQGIQPIQGGGFDGDTDHW